MNTATSCCSGDHSTLEHNHSQKTRTDYDITSFANRFRPMLDGAMEGGEMVTEAGNEHPVLLSTNVAFADIRTADVPANQFYMSATKAFADIDLPYVVFPSSLVSEVLLDICVMKRELFIGVVDGTIEDETGTVFLDGASDSELIKEIRQLFKEAT